METGHRGHFPPHLAPSRVRSIPHGFTQLRTRHHGVRSRADVLRCDLRGRDHAPHRQHRAADGGALGELGCARRLRGTRPAAGVHDQLLRDRELLEGQPSTHGPGVGPRRGAPERQYRRHVLRRRAAIHDRGDERGDPRHAASAGGRLRREHHLRVACAAHDLGGRRAPRANGGLGGCASTFGVHVRGSRRLRALDPGRLPLRPRPGALHLAAPSAHGPVTAAIQTRMAARDPDTSASDARPPTPHPQAPHPRRKNEPEARSLRQERASDSLFAPGR